MLRHSIDRGKQVYISTFMLMRLESIEASGNNDT